MKQKLLYIFLSWVCLSSAALAQRTISGLVTSVKDKQPVIGAVILLDKTKQGTVTDIDGKYSISVPNEVQNITVSYTGMKTMTVPITGAVVNIALEDNEKVLGDVVITALGIKREKRALDYATQEIKADDLNKGGNPSAFSALSGKVAGLQVTTSSGAPGAAVNLRLRGATSITGSNQPLIVIDGIPIDNSQSSTLSNTTGYDETNGDINQNRGLDINPDDIETINVLKGPSAAALYGEQGSNGAIIITTKKGSSSGTKKFSVDISSSVTFDQVNKMPELQSKYVQGDSNMYSINTTRSWGARADTMAWDGIPVNNLDKNGSLVGKSDPTAKTAFKPYDNQNTFFRTGVTTNNSIAISGGTNNGRFRISLSNLYQEGVIPLSGLNKTTVSLSGEHKLGKMAVISGSASYVNSATNGNLSGNNTSAVTYGIYRTPINFDNRNGITNSISDPRMYTTADGSQRSYTYDLGYDPATGKSISFFDNPYYSINRNGYKSDVDRVFGNLTMTVDPLKWLTLMGRMGIDVYSERHKQVFDIGTASTPEGRIIEDQYISRIVNGDFMTTVHGDLFKKLHSSLMVGTNYYNNYSQNLLANADGLIIPGFQNISNAQSVASAESKSTLLRYGLYSALNLDYASQLYFNATARADWTSTLAPGRRNYPYYSVGASWVFTETAKLANSKWFPYGKLRASIAQAGQGAPVGATSRYFVQYQNVGIDGFTNGVSFPINGYNGFMFNQTLNSPLLKPESTISYEGGLDFRFLQGYKTFGGINLEATVYYSRSFNLITAAPIAPSTGYLNQYLNLGEVNNKGVEIVATITPIRTKNVKWDMTINWSKNINNVVSLANGVDQLYLGGGDKVASYAVVGHPYGALYGGDFYRDSKGQVVVDDAKFLDSAQTQLNANFGLPIADPKQKVIGDPTPKWIMGWRNTVSYKGLSLSVLFDIKYGGDIYNGTRGALVTYGRAAETVANRENTAYSAGGSKGHLDANGNVIVTGANDIKVDMTSIYKNLNDTTDKNNNKSIAQLWYTGNGGGFGAVGKQFIEDGSYFRCREIAISYSFPSKWFKAAVLKGVDLTFIARNIFLVTAYKGIDPDQSAGGASNIQGLEWFNLPSTRSYGMTVKFHF
jgi:TonB-linked SusC/RagA family outer membrane protein